MSDEQQLYYEELSNKLTTRIDEIMAKLRGVIDESKFTIEKMESNDSDNGPTWFIGTSVDLSTDKINTAMTHMLNTLGGYDAVGEHLNSFANPHLVTKKQVGLGNVDNDPDITAFINTVDAELQKLSEKDKLLITNVGVEMSAPFNCNNIMKTNNLIGTITIEFASVDASTLRNMDFHGWLDPFKQIVE